MKSIRILLAMSILMSGATLASSSDSWRTLDRQTAKACIAQSGLRQARVGPTTRFSDKIMIDVRPVYGIHLQRHMKGAAAKMLCVYNRKSKRVEVAEFQ